MSVRRQSNILSQSRLDVPQIRSIESAVANDFDELIKSLITGEAQSYVVRGFEINMTGAIGAAASGLQLLVADSAIIHGTSRESGTFFVVPSGTTPEILNSTINTKIDGAFTANSVNYVGIEYERVVDDTTADQVYFWNPTSNTETSKTVPLARILRYKVVITTSVWAANVLPIAQVITDVANNVVSVTDQRELLNRLGKAGRSSPDPSYVYPWTNQAEGRAENPSTSSSSTISPFRGGDKMIRTDKEWRDAVMSMIKEIKGTVFWYSPNVGGSAVNLRADLGNTVFTGIGNVSHNLAVAGRMNWSQDIFVKLIGSRLSYKILANPSSSNTSLADNQVAYLNLVRGITITPNLIFTNASAVVQSVGAVSWTAPLVAGDFVKLSIDDDSKYYQIQSVDSLSQVTLSAPFTGTSTGPSGAKSKYAWGVYEAVAIPSTNRHVRIADRKDVPSSEDTFWLMVRADNGGSVSRVYARFAGQEIEQGETIEVNDNIAQQILDYIGSAGETDDSPDYTAKLGPLASEVTEVTCPAASSITSGQYWLHYSANDSTEWYVWYNKDGSGGNPSPIGKTPIEVSITTGMTADQVATATAAAIDAEANVSATSVGAIVTVTNDLAGSCTDSSNVNVTGLSITVLTQGSGASNFYLTDGDDLTLSIKKLDQALGSALSSLETTDYEEYIDVISGLPSDDTEITGPITAPYTATLPLDSRAGFAATPYTVGKGDLETFLNGVKLTLGEDWDEVGAFNSQSVQVDILIDLEVGDVIQFRRDPGLATGGSGGGSGEANTASNIGSGSSVFKNKVGVDLQFRRLNAGAGVTITENLNDITITSAPSTALSNVATTASNYTLSPSTDDILLADSTGGTITVTLPDAATATGKRFVVKKVAAANTVEIESILNQTLDGINITSSPLILTVQWESVTIFSDGTSYFIE